MQLKGLEGLQKLDLSDTPITEAGLEQLGAMKDLKELDLSVRK